MTHTSGWRNRTGHVAKSVDANRHREFYETMFKDAEVNERFRYMSQGYDILAEICEKVTGAADVADLARDRIFLPLGMKHSAFAAHQGQSVCAVGDILLCHFCQVAKQTVGAVAFL